MPLNIHILIGMLLREQKFNTLFLSFSCAALLPEIHLLRTLERIGWQDPLWTWSFRFSMIFLFLVSGSNRPNYSIFIFPYAKLLLQVFDLFSMRDIWNLVVFTLTSWRTKFICNTTTNWLQIKILNLTFHTFPNFTFAKSKIVVM